MTKPSTPFVVTLTDLTYVWESADFTAHNPRNRTTGKVEHTATRAALVFGSNSILRSYAEFYGQCDSKATSMHNFVAAWTAAMNTDRFDLVASQSLPPPADGCSGRRLCEGPGPSSFEAKEHG